MIWCKMVLCWNILSCYISKSQHEEDERQHEDDMQHEEDESQHEEDESQHEEARIIFLWPALHDSPRCMSACRCTCGIANGPQVGGAMDMCHGQYRQADLV